MAIPPALHGQILSLAIAEEERAIRRRPPHSHHRVVGILYMDRPLNWKLTDQRSLYSLFFSRTTAGAISHSPNARL